MTEQAPMTTAEVADALRVDPARVREWIAAGELAAMDVSAPGAGRASYRIGRDEFRRFLASRRVTPIPDPPRARRLRGVPDPS